MIIDSHCHLDFAVLSKRLNEVINKASEVGVKYFLTICTNKQSFEKIIENSFNSNQNTILVVYYDKSGEKNYIGIKKNLGSFKLVFQKRKARLAKK